MCWSENCCFCFRLHLGCLLIGLISLLASLALAVVSLMYLLADQQDFQSHVVMKHVLSLAHLDINHPSKQLIFGMVFVLSILWSISSFALIVGVYLNASGYVLSYFVFGIFVTFFVFLSSLLFLLRGLWMVALGLAVPLMILTHFLVVVHTFYELQVRGKNILVPEDSADDDVQLIQA